MERVELTLLRLESVIKDRGNDEDESGASSLWLQEDDASSMGTLTSMPQGGSGGASKKLSTKRNSVAPI